ncbi:hypothetical protein CC78DRAFT_537718 [Lojkania enalia]|uniref:DNA-directed RNA polymerase III complex subunit Rpc37 n=1 Tax=Lojkania enalia TaxID=147567 RepID=A0A9P4K1K6_9PLEO|nr:hypothetical protein CC78DRAFT_537718 [Didymosphaeria enalia]
MPAAAIVTIEDDDPVVSEYDVFITPDLEQQLYILQYMNRPPEQPFTEAMRSRPSEVRIKEESGFIEVDVPLNIHQNYNRRTGVKWGEAVRKTKGLGQKAYGIAAGFEKVMPRANNRPGAGSEAPPVQTADEDDNIDEYVANFEDANEKGHVLNTQTWGGQIIKGETGKPNYMVGTFKENELHLTKLGGIVQLRTQFNHLNAVEQLDVIRRKREKESQEGAKPAEPRAFLPTVKRNAGDTSAEVTQQFMKAASAEKWSKLRFYDEDLDTSFGAYEDRLFLKDAPQAAKLHASMNNAQFLDAISAPSTDKHGKKKPAPKRHNHPVIDISDSSDDEPASNKSESQKDTTQGPS